MVLIVLFALAIGSGLARGQVPSPLPEIAAIDLAEDRYPAHSFTFANGVKAIPGIIYWRPKGYRGLTLDLYLPPDSIEQPAAGFPLIVFIHGGSWLGGNLRHKGPFVDFPSVLASLASKGYVVASVEYRLSNQAKFPAQIQDVKAAIRYLRSRSSTYGIDPARAMTWGGSAGGHLAGLAAVSCNASLLEPADGQCRNVSDCLQGAVTWYGIFDMATIANQSREDGTISRDVADAPEWRLLGCFGKNCSHDQIAAASPVAYVDPRDPPMLLIVGDQDTSVPYHQTLEMADKLNAAGVKNKLIVLHGTNHNFMGKNLNETRDANLKALAATFEFFDQTIGNKSAGSTTSTEASAVKAKEAMTVTTSAKENSPVNTRKQVPGFGAAFAVAILLFLTSIISKKRS